MGAIDPSRAHWRGTGGPLDRRNQTHHINFGTRVARDHAHPAAFAPFPAGFGHF